MLCPNVLLELSNGASVPKPTHVPEQQTHRDRRGYLPAAAVSGEGVEESSPFVVLLFWLLEYSRIGGGLRFPKETTTFSSAGIFVGRCIRTHFLSLTGFVRFGVGVEVLVSWVGFETWGLVRGSFVGGPMRDSFSLPINGLRPKLEIIGL